MQTARTMENAIRDQMEHAPVGLIVCQEAGAISSINPCAAEIFGYQTAELAGQNIKLLLTGFDTAGLLQKNYARTRHVEITGQHKDGRPIQVMVSVAPAPAGSSNVVLSLRDITAEKRQAEQDASSVDQMRNLARRLQQRQEAERTRLAREIRQAVEPQVSNLKRELAALAQSPGGAQDSARERLTAMMTALEQTELTLWRLAGDLRPEILDEVGLAAAIETHSRQFLLGTGIEWHCVPTLKEANLDRERCAAVFRIYQEILANVVRHARATQIAVSLKNVDGQLFLKVKDNGRGLRNEQASSSKSLGLRSMQERAGAFGGVVEFEGGPRKGTTVIARIPLAQTEEPLADHD